MPSNVASGMNRCVLINLLEGGFRVDSGSLTESIPIANLTGAKVVSVLYRMASENPFSAAVDDAVAVYKDLLKTYQPRHIAIYGTSASAILTAEVTVRLTQLGLPLQGATGVFSGAADVSRPGDSVSMNRLNGLSGYQDAYPRGAGILSEYVDITKLTDPLLSPVYADLTGFHRRYSSLADATYF